MDAIDRLEQNLAQTDELITMLEGIGTAAMLVANEAQDAGAISNSGRRDRYQHRKRCRRLSARW